MANLASRFLLEIAALIGIGLAAWGLAPDPWRWLLAVALPLLAAAAWAVFAVPDDPSRSGRAPVPVSGRLRLVIELGILSGGIACYALAGHGMIAALLAALLVLHYGLSGDRIRWLLDR